MSFWASANPTQKYARIMEIACYVLVLPGSAFIFYMFFIFGLSGFPTPEMMVHINRFYCFFALGLILMAFYMTSARLLLSRRVEVTGWVISILYNLVPHVLMISVLVDSTSQWDAFFLFIYIVVILGWPTSALLFSAQALYFFLKPERHLG